PLRGAAESGSFLVVGEPGAGKSGVCYGLARELSDAGRNLVFLPVDALNVDTTAGLSAELQIAHSLPDVIRNWPGSEPGILVIDALDAARKLETQALLRTVLEEVVETANDRWRIIASVRQYDLRQGKEWSRLFRGPPPIPGSTEQEFQHLRHVFIKRLDAQELAQIATSYAALNELLQTAPNQLKDLLLNIFNLHLLAELLNDGVVSAELENIRTQPELLDAYWKHRVHGNDGRRDAREGILLSAAEGMIASRALQVARANLRTDPNIGALNDLERHGVLVASEADGRPDDDILLFAHNILFDYVVARLIFRRGRDPAYLVGRLRETPELALMLGPSLTLALADRWGVPAVNRNEFWNVAFALEREPAIPEIARLQAPMVIAEDGSVGIGDLGPILTALGVSTGAEAAEALLQHLIGALFVLAMIGRALVGPGAGPWSVLAERLTTFKRDRLAYSASPLISKLIDQIDAATAEQLSSLGQASRDLLAYAWARQPRQSRLVTAALHATCLTIASNVRGTEQLLRAALLPEHMEQFAYEEFRHITRNIDRIIDADARLAADIYEAAFRFDERSDATTDMSGSQLLALRSNRRQDYQGSWYELTERYPKFLKAAPGEAAWS
ncbi:MAG: ATP-binding protein, partial [Candidatus Acidiferrales bacterium]